MLKLSQPLVEITNFPLAQNHQSLVESAIFTQIPIPENTTTNTVSKNFAMTPLELMMREQHLKADSQKREELASKQRHEEEMLRARQRHEEEKIRLSIIEELIKQQRQ